MSYHGHKCREPVVPLDPEKGLVKKASTKVSGTVTPAALGTMPFYWEEMVEGSIYGYPIHARCWELLSEHSLGAFVQTDPKGLFYFLCRAMEKCQDGMFQREDTNLYCHEGEGKQFLTWRRERFSELAVLKSCQDEKGAELVRTQIRRAQRRTKKRFQRGKVKCETRLARLPLEVLSMIGMYLPAKDARAVQDVTRLYLGDAYWRQQIPWRMFPEIREIQKKKLDWEFLYQELERLRLDPKKLVTRKCIMRRLDWYLKYHKHIEMTRRLWGSDYNSEDEVYDECSRYD